MPRYSCAGSKPCLQISRGCAGVQIPMSWVGWPCLVAPCRRSGHVAAGQHDRSGEFGFGRRRQGRRQHRGVQGDTAWSGMGGIRMQGNARLGFWGWYRTPLCNCFFFLACFPACMASRQG